MSTLKWISVGDGPTVLVVGGALRSAENYHRFAEELAHHGWRAVVVQRRGRAGSPARDQSAGIQLECNELAEVAREVDARGLFGHSFGGLVALEAAGRGLVDVPLVLYEPGVSIGRSLHDRWIPRYNALIADGRRREAFAHFVRQSAGAPAIVRHLPEWYLRLVLAAMMRRAWPAIEPLLEANADEHRLVASCDDHIDTYRSIVRPVRLLGGSKSPATLTTLPFAALSNVLANCQTEILPGLDHFGPDEKAPQVVATRTDQLLRAAGVNESDS